MPDAKATIKEMVARIPKCTCNIKLTDRHLIIDNRKLNKHIRRRRVCKMCGGKFTTYEITAKYFKYLQER